LRNFGARPVEAEERAAGEILVEVRAIGNGGGTELVEDVDRQAAGLAAVFNISGGTAEIKPALAMRFLPWRPI
jgi:hypothetical protein